MKGANASISLARSEASERRKRTLLLEYRQVRRQRLPDVVGREALGL